MVAAADAPNYAKNWASKKNRLCRNWAGTMTSTTTSGPIIEDACGGELLDEDADEVIDVVMLWWRDDDGDLVDRVIDAITPLADDGVIWVLTPKTGKPGHVSPCRNRRIGADGRVDADVVGQPRRLERQQAGAAEVQGRGEALVLHAGTEAPDFTLKDQNGQAVTLSDFRGAKNVLVVFFPLAFTGICQGGWTRSATICPKYENDDAGTLAISVGPPPTHKVWATESGFLFPVLSDFWPHGAVAQAYDVFNSDAGFANRGTFVVDRSGVIRFAEMKQPGEARDQSVWTEALAALSS